MPLKGVPFGREWTSRNAPGAQSGKTYLAELVTSCIDVNAPHRACHWMPLDPPAAAAEAPQAAAPRATAPRRFAARVHRGTYATCWTVGALALIGWLVVTHAPPDSLVATARKAQSVTGAAPDTARVPVAMPARTLQATEQRVPAEDIGAVTIASSAPQSDVVPAPRVDGPLSVAADRHGTAPARDAKPLAEPQTRLLVAERQAAPTRRTAAPAVPPAGEAERVATRPRPVPPPVRAARPAAPAARDDAFDDMLDDPRALIAMADTLRAERPALTPAAQSSGTDADWSTRLTHRRLTDAPDAFAR
ncbi:conserved protein of unknown function [Burkholderia multivorans]